MRKYGWHGDMYSKDHEPPHLHIYKNRELLFTIKIADDFEPLSKVPANIPRSHIRRLQEGLRNNEAILSWLWRNRAQPGQRPPVIEI